MHTHTCTNSSGFSNAYAYAYEFERTRQHDEVHIQFQTHVPVLPKEPPPPLPFSSVTQMLGTATHHRLYAALDHVDGMPDLLVKVLRVLVVGPHVHHRPVVQVKAGDDDFARLCLHV